MSLFEYSVFAELVGFVPEGTEDFFVDVLANERKGKAYSIFKQRLEMVEFEEEDGDDTSISLLR